MPRVFKSGSVALAVVGLLAIGSVEVMAQSGSRSNPPSRSGGRPAQSAGSGQRAPEQAPFALEGYCPVSILEMRKWVKGDPAHGVVYDGRTYLFPNEQGKQMFEANPAKYVPALGGDCVVALVKMGKRVPGNIRHASFHGGRLFLFSNAEGHQMFRAAPATYANVDVALGGKCPVCLANMNQSVAGNPEIAAFYKGLRYFFPAAEQRQAFVTSPQKYVSRSDSSTKQPPGGSTTRRPAGSGSGSR